MQDNDFKGRVWKIYSGNNLTSVDVNTWFVMSQIFLLPAWN